MISTQPIKRVGWLILAGMAGLAILATGFSTYTAKNDGLKMMPRDQEIEMALSAAPPNLRKDATVYVLEKNGYVKVREGTNGFSCLVVRFGDIIAPYCYDAEGAQTTMLADFRRVELMLAGKSLKEAQAIIADEYKAGKLIAPRKHGVAYMLSPEFKRHDPKTGEAKQFYPPHIMFYAPYKTNADFGIADSLVGSHKYPCILNEGKPDAYIIVTPPIQ